MIFSNGRLINGSTEVISKRSAMFTSSATPVLRRYRRTDQNRRRTTNGHGGKLGKSGNLYLMVVGWFHLGNLTAVREGIKSLRKEDTLTQPPAPNQRFRSPAGP